MIQKIDLPSVGEKSLPGLNEAGLPPPIASGISSVVTADERAMVVHTINDPLSPVVLISLSRGPFATPVLANVLGFSVVSGAVAFAQSKQAGMRLEAPNSYYFPKAMTDSFTLTADHFAQLVVRLAPDFSLPVPPAPGIEGGKPPPTTD